MPKHLEVFLAGHPFAQHGLAVVGRTGSSRSTCKPCTKKPLNTTGLLCDACVRHDHEAQAGWWHCLPNTVKADRRVSADADEVYMARESYRASSTDGSARLSHCCGK